MITVLIEKPIIARWEEMGNYNENGNHEAGEGYKILLLLLLMSCKSFRYRRGDVISSDGAVM